MDSMLQKIFFRGTISALVLQGVGFIIPGWAIFKELDSKRHFSFSIGIWFMVFCDKNEQGIGNCETATVHEVIGSMPEGSWATPYLREFFSVMLLMNTTL